MWTSIVHAQSATVQTNEIPNRAITAAGAFMDVHRRAIESAPGSSNYAPSLNAISSALYPAPLIASTMYCWPFSM